MASTYTLTVDGMTAAELRQAVGAALGSKLPAAGQVRLMPGGSWEVTAFDPDDAEAFDFEPTAEVIFYVRAADIDEAEAEVAKAVIGVLTKHQVNAWLGFEGTETLHRLNGKTSRASRRLWGDLADLLNEGLRTAA